MDQCIAIGRYLCLKYFNGNIQPSQVYEQQGEKESGKWYLAKCVENAIENAHPQTAYVWAALLAGDLQGLTSWPRARLLGGGAWNRGLNWDLRQDWVRELGILEGSPIHGSFGKTITGNTITSIDGNEAVRVSEVCLYYEVGVWFTELIRYLDGKKRKVGAK